MNETYSALLNRLLKLAYQISARLVERRLSYDLEKLGVWLITHGWSISHSRVRITKYQKNSKAQYIQNLKTPEN